VFNFVCISFLKIHDCSNSFLELFFLFFFFCMLAFESALVKDMKTGSHYCYCFVIVCYCFVIVCYCFVGVMVFSVFVV